MKSSNNYKDILLEIEQNKQTEEMRVSIETIQLDINRTPFEGDVEKKRLVIKY